MLRKCLFVFIFVRHLVFFYSGMVVKSLKALFSRGFKVDVVLFFCFDFRTALLKMVVGFLYIDLGANQTENKTYTLHPNLKP